MSLVFDFMETDLEVIIRESRLILTSANIKAYMIMTLKGLNYLHNNWILHRVSTDYFDQINSFAQTGSETKQSIIRQRWNSETS